MVHAGSNTHPVTLPRGRPFYTFRDIPKEDEKTPRARAPESARKPSEATSRSYLLSGTVLIRSLSARDLSVSPTPSDGACAPVRSTPILDDLRLTRSELLDFEQTCHRGAIGLHSGPSASVAPPHLPANLLAFGIGNRPPLGLREQGCGLPPLGEQALPRWQRWRWLRRWRRR